MDISTISKKFVFPEDRDDLLVSETGKYSVEKVVPVHKISSDLETVEGMVKKRTRWSWWILEYFDTFYSIVVKFKTLETSVKEVTWRVLLSGIEQHTEALARSFTTDRLETQEKMAHLNAVQMSVYILVELFKCYEEENRGTTNIVTTKKRGKKTDVVEKYWGSDDRQFGLQVLRRLLDLNLALLWDPPIVPEEFVDVIAGSCYKLFENPDVGKCKKTCEYLFHVLGILVKRYNHCLGACMKIVQLLQQYEHLTSPFANMMLVCVRDYDIKSIVSQIVREIAQIDPAELVRDTNATRNYCNFLLEISETCGSVVLSVISSLLPHLDGDSYTMRNCVLSVFGELITSILSDDNVDENLKETRESLFDRLELHIHDQNAFVRSKSIQIWTKLIQQRCVPIPRQHTLVDLVVGAIQDKSSNVRKNALVFITTYLGCNPFSDKLSLESLKEKLEEEEEKLKKLKDDIPDIPESQESGEMEVDVSPEIAQKMDEAQKQVMVVQYLKDCVHFTQQMHRVIVLVSQLLASKSSSDVLESIDFLVSAYEFGLKAAQLGVRKMLCLVFNPDQHVKDAVVSAYIRLYIQNDTGKRLGPESVAKNLLEMTYGATLGELMSLEELVKLFLEKEHISPRVVKVLLDMLIDKTPETPLLQLNAAAIILAMVASEDNTLVTENINLLLSAGFDGSMSLATQMCTLLQKAVPSKKRKGEFTRLEETHRLISTITTKLLDTFDDKTVDWVGFSDQAVKTVFCLSEVPDTVCADLINQLLIRTFPPKQGDLLDNVQPDPKPAQDAVLAGLHMYRLLSVLGQVALCILVHLDTSVLEELKKRAVVRDNMEVKKRDASRKKNSSSVDAAEEELGLQGATADDTEAEHIREVLEKEIVTGGGYLAKFAPLLTHICSSPQLYPCSRIQNAAVLALCKFMLVSSEFCEDKIQLLFTLLEKSTNERTRCNIMISIHDLVIRFPNLLVNWTGKIYARLRDSSVTVRSTTIRILTNLILNDMVKVKGQISDLAVCLEDEDPKIRSLTQLFFAELSKKANAIYNVMPDMISHLSDPDSCTVTPGQFQNIMKCLFEFIDKDKQAEALVEKLCHRFRATRSDKQWHDLSYCLTLLQYNDKCIKKLADNIACYHDKLSDQVVYENFISLIEKARKTVKTEQKEHIDDLEIKINFCYNRGGDEPPTDEILSQMKDLLQTKPLPAERKQKPRPGAGRRKAKKTVESSDSDESGKENFEKPKPVARGKRNVVPKRGRQNLSSDDDLELPDIKPDSPDSDEAFEISIRKVKKNTAKGQKPTPLRSSARSRK